MKAEYAAIVCGGDMKDCDVAIYYTQHVDDITIKACKDVALNSNWFNRIYSVETIRLNDWEEANQSVITAIQEIKELNKEAEKKERAEYERLKAKFEK